MGNIGRIARRVIESADPMVRSVQEIAEDIVESECYFAGNKAHSKEDLEGVHGVVLGRLLYELGDAVRRGTNNPSTPNSPGARPQGTDWTLDDVRLHS